MYPSLVFIFSFFYSSPNTMMSRSLRSKSIPKVFSGFFREAHDNTSLSQLPNHYKWCALLPKSQATSNHGWLIFKDVSRQCSLRQFFFNLFFSNLHPTPCCPKIWAIKIFEKFSPDSLEAHDNCQTTTSGVRSYQNHKLLQTTGGLFSKTFRVNVPFVSFFYVFL